MAIRIDGKAIAADIRAGLAEKVKGMKAEGIQPCLAVILADLFDDVIRGDDYLTQTYDVPVLGIIPDLSVQGGEKTGYGYGTRVRRQ